MTGDAHPGTRLLGSLRSADRAGVVRIEDRHNTDIGDLWSALTDPGRLARWYGQVEGDLRLGGELRLCLEPDGWDGASPRGGCSSRFRPVFSQTCGGPWLPCRADGFVARAG